MIYIFKYIYVYAVKKAVCETAETCLFFTARLLIFFRVRTCQ